MRTRINVAEMLRNCPEGMELDCAMFENLFFYRIEESSDCPYPITCYVKHKEIQNVVQFSKYGTYTNHPNGKCVIFPKGKSSWEEFVPLVEFKAGDIVRTNLGNIVILREMSDTYYYNTYCGVTHDDEFYLCVTVRANRLATEEERQMLFKAIEDNGYKWDAEKKCLEELEKERFDISSFKPYDKVLAGGYAARQCIPFEGNEHLLDTKDDC